MENKKLYIFVLSLFVLLILNLFIINLNLILSQPNLADSPLEINPETGIPKDVEKLQESYDKYKNLTKEEQRKEYLKQEWGKILRNWKFIGPIIKGYEKISPYTDPIFKYTIGMAPSLSWLFVLTFLIWITLFLTLFRGISLITDSNSKTLIILAFLITIAVSLEKLDAKVILFAIIAVVCLVILITLKMKAFLSLIISLIFSFLLTGFVSPIVADTLLKSYEPLKLFGFPGFLANLIINLVSTLSLWWVQLIVIVLIIIGILIYDAFISKTTKALKGYIEKKKEEQGKQLDEINRKRLNDAVEQGAKITKALRGSGF